ncbi:hypothetical protein BKA65DRAFT_404736 [Rhexocercosporidium sp. MPI-PUGE-AT-0058]|nr:hypothetical protein BKA65DRAFT_404736 [Rhexocercosporidium sp. MPI-PUGE-AT-0058]
MANFHPNRWYEINVADSFLKDKNLAGGELLSLDRTGGSVFMYPGDARDAKQQWQMYPFNSTNYVLRTRGSGPFGYLAVTYLATEPTPGYTVATTKNASIADNSMFWRIGPWGDGTFWLSNEANGTAWRLEAKANQGLAMSSNITSLRPGQRFEFQQLGTVDNSSFSTLVVRNTSPSFLMIC